MATAAKRKQMLAVMDYLYANRAKVHYPVGDRRTETIHAVRTMAQLKALVERPQGLTIDCSQAVTLICNVAGLKNPNGADEDGYTGTLLSNPKMKHYSNPKSAGVGAIVIFGPGTGDHAAMVHTPGENPILFSHGQESDPRLINLVAEASGHRPPVTFLSIINL